MLRILYNWKKLKKAVKEYRQAKFDNEILYLPNHFFDVLLLAEDHRFRRHIGVDFIALLRSIYKSLIVREKQGGSTIAMQLVRTITNDREQTVFRKVREIVLAIILTSYLNKDDILIMYMRIAYFGWNMEGLESACIKLKIDINNIEISDAVLLVSRLKYPEPRFENKNQSFKIYNRINYLYKRFVNR